MTSSTSSSQGQDSRPAPSEMDRNNNNNGNDNNNSSSSATICNMRTSKSTPQLRSKPSITPRVIVTRTDIPVIELGSPTGPGIMRATTMARLSSYEDLQQYQGFEDDDDIDSDSSGHDDDDDDDDGGSGSGNDSSDIENNSSTDDRESDLVADGQSATTTTSSTSTTSTTTTTTTTANNVTTDATAVAAAATVQEEEREERILRDSSRSRNDQLLDQSYYSRDRVRSTARLASRSTADGNETAEEKQQRQSKQYRRSHSARSGRSRERKSPMSSFVTEIENRLISASETPFESPPTVRQVSIQLVKSINTRFHFDVSSSKREKSRRVDEGSSNALINSGSDRSGRNAPSISKKAVRSICHPLSNVELKWENPPKNVLIMKHPFARDINGDISAMTHFLTKEKGCMVYMERLTHKKMLKFDHTLQVETYSDEEKMSLHNIIDLVLVCGGDGTLLHTAHLFPTAVPPILSFHTGSLGMLTSFAKLPDFRAVLDRVLSAKRTFVSIRMRLSCRIIRKESSVAHDIAKGDSQTESSSRPSASPQETVRHQVLNEVVVDRGVSPFLTSLEMYCNDNMVTTVAADGLIVASPTGSTAYSMSAGGSMVHSDVPCILVTPVCPHSLSFRPIILPDTVVLKIKVSEKSRGTAWVSIDGKFRQELMKGDAIEITTSVWPMPLICSEDPTRDWFRTLSTLLHWNTREVHQKELPENWSSEESGDEEQ